MTTKQKIIHGVIIAAITLFFLHLSMDTPLPEDSKQQLKDTVSNAVWLGYFATIGAYIFYLRKKYYSKPQS